MAEMRKMKSSVENDIWFSGKYDITPNGGITYFVCQYFDKMHYNEERKEYETYCKYYEKPSDGSECNIECDQYGRCETCNGFSAVRCQECEIVRPE